MPTLGFALAVGLVCNGLSRPFFGLLSDYAGRETTMLIAFLLEGIAIFALLWFAADPVLFVVLSGLVYFAWGQIFALFPATCTDLYGKKFASTNYSMLYTAKGTAALLVPLGNVLTTATGGWTAVFVLASALNILAAFLAFAVLKPMRMRDPLPDCVYARDSHHLGASLDSYVPALRPPSERDDADRCVCGVLPLQGLRPDAETEAGRLLRVLQLWNGSLSADPGGAVWRCGTLMLQTRQ
jgi:MFS family permease